MDFEQLWRNKQRGRKAKAYGELFENIFETHCRQRGMVCTKFPIGARRVGLKQLVQIKTPWDFILTHKGRSAFIDTKTSQGKNFVHSAIELHQVQEMFKHEAAGSVGGYVIWLRETDHVIFLWASELLTLMQFKGSITEKHPKATHLGSVNGAGGMQVVRIFDTLPVTA
jgi:penicillin-binding protein-related factor A (putative recombinase)